MNVGRTITALKILNKPSEEYVPYLKDEFPSVDKKKELLDNISGGSILISDYRSFRGCEASHCIVFSDLENPIAGTIMAEMLSRTMVYVDFIVLPKKNAISFISNPIQIAFDTWKKRGLVESIAVEFHDKDESSVIFNLQQQTQLKSVTIETLGFNFDLSDTIENEESKSQYK